MSQSSSRVKLNRVALKDIAEVKLVPRRRRVSKSPNNFRDEREKQEEKLVVSGVLSVRHAASVRSYLTDQMSPQAVTHNSPGGEPEESCVGTQKEKRKNYVSPCKDIKRGGPCTRGKYHQSKPNTRSKCKLDHIRRLNLRLRFTWCCCHNPQSKLEKPGLHVSKVLYEMGVRSDAAPTSRKTTKGRTPSTLKCNTGAGKSSQTRCEFRTGGFNRKRLATRVANSNWDRDRKGQRKGRASSTVCDPPPAAAETRQGSPGAPSIPTGLSNNKNRHLISTGFSGSEGSLRRAVGASHCGKLGQESSSPRSEKSTLEFKINKENPVAETSKKIIVWINKYPKVTLCDIDRYCDTCSHRCGFVLPDALQAIVVRCFKQNMRAGFRFAPGCLRRNQHNSEECALTSESVVATRVQSEKTVCQRQSLTEQQTKVKETAETLSGLNLCHFLEGSTSGATATCSASLLLGQHTRKRERRTIMLDRDVEEIPESEEVRLDKRIRLGDSINGTLLSIPGINCNKGGKLDSADEEQNTFTRMSDDTRVCPELTLDCSSRIDTAVKENGVPMKRRDHISEPTQMQISSELLCQSSEVDTDDPESFTCQRTKAYLRNINFSCARTNMPWPFSNRGSNLAKLTGTTDCPANRNATSARSSQHSDTLTDAPTESSSHAPHLTSHRSDERQNENGESILAESNMERQGNMSSCSSDNKIVTPVLSTPSLHGRELSSTPFTVPETNSSMSTPSLSEFILSDCDAGPSFSPMSCPFTHGGLSSLSLSLSPSSFLSKKDCGLADPHSAVASLTSPCLLKAVEKPLIHPEETQMTSCSSSSQHNSDCSDLTESSLILPQDEQKSESDFFSDRSPPTLEPYYKTSPVNHQFSTPKEQCEETNSSEFMLLPMLSPVTSPLRRSQKSSQLPNKGSSQMDKESEDLRKCKMLPEHHMLQAEIGSCEEYLDHQQCGEPHNENLDGILSQSKTLSTPSSVGAMGDEEDSWDETDCEDDLEQRNRNTEQSPLDSKIQSTVTSGVLTEASSSPSSEEDDGGDVSDERQTHFAREVASSPSEIGHVRDESEETDDTQPGVLDEFTAFEQDILLVDVIQDDPELFENLPEQSLLKLGPTRVSEHPKTRAAGVTNTLWPQRDGASVQFEPKLTPVDVDLLCNSPDITEERDSRPWRPQYGSIPSKMQNAHPAIDKQTRNMHQPDSNNNHVSGDLERHQPVQTMSSPRNIPSLTTLGNGPRIVNLANTAEFWRQKSNAYCRQYFSESLSCGFKMCRFQHVPLDGDEKFCVETVTRFSKIPMCLQKAGAVFTGYYQNNPPGVYFSMPVLLTLLWALLKSGMVSDVFPVLSVSLAHRKLPSHEFLLALFNLVREKGLTGFVPELMQLTFKMASAGLVLNLDCLDCVKNIPEFQPASPASALLPTSTPFPEYLNLAHSIVEIELCNKQEDWRRMGEVFRSICQFSQHPSQVERISGRIAIALLSESKDKLCLPFDAFAKTVCQNESEDNLIKSFLGRIGVSLMLRYHKTHQWAKGRRVVEVLFSSKVNYSTLKGLFGNEDGASRCCLITVAAELLLLSGSVEGALNTIRENKWFLSSSEWPCEPADLESRTRVLMRLAEKTSHRDTLDVLSNLPGIKEPHDQIDVSRYITLFNSHLQMCVDRQILPVASDTVDFMLSRNLAVDERVLQILLHKLGKQNLWLCARKVFRHSLSVGYYPGVSAPSGFMSLMVPCRLGEVEMALTLEMFITVNATVILQLPETSTSSLSITLKRTQSCESEYLSAGSRLLSAASVPQPKLAVHYTSVNASQEQVFTLAVPSARRWFRHNHLWANDLWMQ